ncbi:hypothetical protein SEA_BARCO_36 [Gordonia phage Barco]|nr:hypothetical protein SEA_BARCO_36 [Gordonia phage Barco]
MATNDSVVVVERLELVAELGQELARVQVEGCRGVAPCPPPIVSTNGDSIGGGANTDPVTMAGDAPSYSYEAPEWEKTPEPEPEPEEPTEETPAE